MLFYSAAESDATPQWRLYYATDDNEPKRLETGFAPGVIECSPTAWQDESGWHISFVSNSEPNGSNYRLYRMDGSTLETLSQPISLRKARTGFVYQDRIVVGEIQDVVHVHDTNGDHKIIIPGAFLYRVSYRADSPLKLLISGEWIGENEDVFTLEYDLATDAQRYIECDGLPAYKCTILDNEILYAKRNGDAFEHRTIYRSQRNQFVPCRIAERDQDIVAEIGIKVTKQCGCRRSESERQANSVRPGCLECVEKHLGAACVILSEVQTGYAYRLRLVGHLHEAQDESQDWPKLFDAIRNSRKAYQHSGITPDWEEHAKIIDEVRHAR